MSSTSPEEKRLSRFLDQVERLCDEIEQLRNTHNEWKKKAKSYILDIEELEEENERLDETVQTLKIELSDFAGQLEERFKAIRDEARKLPVDRTDE